MAHALKKYKMMSGTQSQGSYLVIARRGGFALGVKPEAVMDGKAFGSEGTTWFSARLRSAPVGDLFKGEPDPKVVSFSDMNLTTASAWPEVVWEKAGAQRASTVIGVLLRGKPHGTDDQVQAFLAEVDKGKLAGKMADYVATLAGEENLVLSVSDIRDWMDEYYKTVVEKIMDMLKMKAKVTAEMEAKIGTFGMQAQILKKVYEQNQPAGPEHEAEDKDSDDPEV